MEFFRLRPQATFGVAFFACSLLISYCNFDCKVPTLVAAALFLGLLTAALVRWRRASADAKQTFAALLSLFLAPAIALGLGAYRDAAEKAIPRGKTDVIAVVRTGLSSAGGYERYILDVRSVDGRECDFSAEASGYGLSLGLGDIIEASADITPVLAHCRGDDRYLRSRGAVAEMELSAVRRVGHEDTPAILVGSLREEIGSRIRSCVGESAPLVTALVTGDRDGLDGTLRKSFYDIGIPHLLAISGLHLSVVTACVSFFARGLRRKRYFVLIPAILLYAAISGFSASVVRAGTMALIMCFAELIGRRGDAVSVISLAVSAIILASPGAVYDVGFLLSVLCVFALAVISYRKSTRRAAGGVVGPALNVMRRVLRAAAKSVAATVAITIVTLPVIASEFGTLALIAPLANLVFIPLFSLLICAALILVILAFVPGFGAAAGMVTGLYATLLVRLVTWFDGVFGNLTVSLDYPFFGVLSVFCAVSFVLTCISKRPRGFAVLTGALVCSMIVSATVTEVGRADTVNIIFRAEAQGDMITVTDASALYVIDSARPVSSLRRRLEEEMRSACVTHISTYVFTHYHSRSDVYFRRLLSAIHVSEAVLPMPQNEDERELCLRMAQIALEAGCAPRLFEDSIMLGSVKLSRALSSAVPGSVESVFALSISAGDEAVTYLSAGFFDTNEEFRAQCYDLLSDNVIIGSHGIKNPSAPVFVSLPSNLTTLTEGQEIPIVWKKRS